MRAWVVAAIQSQPSPVGTQPGPDHTFADVERLSLDTYRNEAMADIRADLPPMDRRPRNTWAWYTSTLTGERWQVYFDGSGYAIALVSEVPNSNIVTYAVEREFTDDDVQSWFAGPEGQPTRPSPFTPPPPPYTARRRPPTPVIPGEGYDALPMDFDFDATVRRTVAASMVSEGLAASEADVLNGPPNSFAFIGPWSNGREGALFYYGPNGGVVAQSWVAVKSGGDVTAANPDGLMVSAVHWVKTHTSYRRLGLSTKLYEWATINGFKIEVESGMHGLTAMGEDYWRSRRARPFSRVVMASTRWSKDAMGNPETFDDVLRGRRRKVVADAMAALPTDLEAANVPLIPEDAPTTYQLGKGTATAIPTATDPLERSESKVIRLIPHSEETVGRFEDGAEPSQTVEMDPTRVSLDDIDFAGAYSVRKHKQDAVVTTLVGDVVKRLGLAENGQLIRVEGMPIERMSEVFDDLGEMAPNVTLHDQSGYIEFSMYDAMRDDDVLEGLRQIAAKYGGKMRVMPAHIRWYWHDESTLKAAQENEDGSEGWFAAAPDDAVIVAGAVRQRLVAGGDARADRIVARRRTRRRRAPDGGGPAGVGTGDARPAGRDDGAIAERVRAFPRAYPANAIRRDPDIRVVEGALNSTILADVAKVAEAVLPVVERLTGGVNVSWTGAVAAIDPNNREFEGAAAVMGWDGTLHVDTSVELPRRELVHVVTHEMLHALSGITAAEFATNPWLEEGLVEALARELQGEVLVELSPGETPPTSYAYEDVVQLLLSTAKDVNIPARTFLLRLIETPHPDRLRTLANWVSERAGERGLRSLVLRQLMADGMTPQEARNHMAVWDALGRLMADTIPTSQWWYQVATDRGATLWDIIHWLTEDDRVGTERGKAMMALINGDYGLAYNVVAGRVTLAPFPATEDPDAAATSPSTRTGRPVSTARQRLRVRQSRRAATRRVARFLSR
jgi:hypothetical protein